jgi:alkylation response protein AidB-like acyl-CoA dehydrogenase
VPVAFAQPRPTPSSPDERSDIRDGALAFRFSRSGNGYINDYPTGRLLRDAKLYEIGAGTSEIRRMLIGRELFDKSA